MNRRLIAFGLIGVAPATWAQQPPDIGIGPVALSESAYVFDTAEDDGALLRIEPAS